MAAAVSVLGLSTWAAQAQIREESQAMVLLRGLPSLDTSHSVAIVELDPESEDFGKIIGFQSFQSNLKS